MKTPVVGLDFDGTLVTHAYPDIGADIGAFDALKRITDKFNVNFVLFTMRSGDELAKAAKYCGTNGLTFYSININPTQKFWTKSPKAHCNLYIDDAALGVPLVINQNKSNRPFVEWNETETKLDAWLTSWYGK